MSDADEAALMCCAYCGVAEVDEIKLKICDDCDLVRYCSDDCKADHRLQHEAKCKERAAELRDDILFKQPESTHRGDCPICCLPHLIDPNGSAVMGCCSQIICNGCAQAHIIRDMDGNGMLKNLPTCPFCRKIIPTSQKEANSNSVKRIDSNDPVALRQMGLRLYRKADYDAAFKYLLTAAKLGDVEARGNVGVMYSFGRGVQNDEKKAVHHWEEAAIAGHSEARCNLAAHEFRNGRSRRGVKHYIIAANLGDDMALQRLKQCYVHGEVSKEDFAAALRAHQTAVDATKSKQREAAAKYNAWAATLPSIFTSKS